jgi:TonB family protein
MIEKKSYRAAAFWLVVSPSVILGVVLSLAARGSSQTKNSPAVLKAVAPSDYPAIAAQARVGGRVAVEVTIDPAGMVAEARMIDVDGPPRIFEQDWYELLAREWRFASDQGAADLRKVRIEFVFRLMPRGTPREKLGTIFIPPYQVEVREEEPERVKLPAP